MESPQSWGKAEHIVYKAIQQAEEGRKEFRAGLSMTRQITDALRKAGYLAVELAENTWPE